ncbi:MAG TPA: rod shape-determining protein MreC [Candidatus Wirthbacteria bacterium]|nr:rod shape-determining protein MreC [Candidatus Wirthbacteria bacterium]
MLNFWRGLNNFGRAVFLTLVSILVIFLAEVRADYAFRNILATMSTPIVQSYRGIGKRFLDFGAFIGNIGKLDEENKLLQEQVLLLQKQLVESEEVRLENQRLRDQLYLVETKGYDFLSARIIAKEPIGAIKMISVNQGYRDQVQEKMPVVVSEGLLVGYVAEVFASSSRVILLSDSSIEIPARLQKSRADGMIKGQQLGQGLVMELIPQVAAVERGNRVITSGLGGNYPPGLLIGFVQSVEAEPNALFKRADIMPAVDFERLEEVMIILDY